MAEGQGVSSLPLPPMQYVNFYTDDNVKKGRTPKPPPPIKDNYSMFGKTYNIDEQIIRPLESQDLRRLHPQDYDHKRELKKLNHSILVNFLDLLDILILAPEQHKRAEKIDHLTLLFIHMHHLINEFRPHQARETLRMMMELQKKQRLETAERFQCHLEKVRELLRSAIGALPDDDVLDSKLTIKIEPNADAAAAPSSSIPSSFPTLPVKQEPDEMNGGENEETPDVSVADRMMCNIVDALT